MNSRTTERAWLVAAAAVALSLRLWAAAERTATATLTGMVDSQIYMQLAAQLSGGNWLPQQGFYMSPLYPYLLAATGTSATRPWPALVLQTLMGVAALVALSLVARRVAGPVAGVATLLLGALAAPIAVYDLSLLSDGPAFALSAVALSLLLLRPRSRRALLLSGVCFALAYGLRANLLPAAVLCGAWSFRAHRGAVWLFALPLLLLMGGLAAMNRSAEGHFTPRSFNAGQNLYIGNNPAADGGYTTLNEIHPGDMMGRAAAERARGRELDAAEIEGFWRRQALDYIREHPASALKLTLRRLVLFFHPHELPQMEALDLVRRESTALRLSAVGMPLLLPLALVGFASLRRRRELWPLWFSFLSALGICMLFFVNGRLRLPMHLTLLPLAGMGVAALFEAVRSRKWRRPAIAAAAGVALLCLLALYPTHAPYRNALSAARYAVLEGLAGQRDRALEWMRVEMTLEEGGSGPWNRPELRETLRQHEDSRWILRSERAAAWFVLEDLKRAFDDMQPAADAMPENMRAQQGLLDICRRLREAGMGGGEVDAAARRARSRLQTR